MLLDKAENKYCYDPTFVDLGRIIQSMYVQNNSTAADLTFGKWTWPQLPGMTITAIITVLATCFDQRLASYLAKKHNIKMKVGTKVQ
jgi:hypothetical protein